MRLNFNCVRLPFLHGWQRGLLMATLALLSMLLPLHPAMAADDGLVAVPPLSAHVVDQINVLNAPQRQSLENILQQYEQRTGSQIAVLLMASTAPEAIEQYSIRVAEAWKLGRKGVDDGVLLIVAKDNPKALRRLRIEAGRGVQGSLTDAQSKRILEDMIAPHFQQNDFYGGLVAGVVTISTLLDQEKLTAAQRQSPADDDGDWLTLVVVLVFLALFFTMLLKARRSQSRNRLNNNDWGHAAGVIVGSILEQSTRNARGGGGFSTGGFGGGFGSSGDSGGFSGGGGTFDGGGASGDW